MTKNQEKMADPGYISLVPRKANFLARWFSNLLNTRQPKYSFLMIKLSTELIQKAFDLMNSLSEERYLYLELHFVGWHFVLLCCANKYSETKSYLPF